MVKQDIHLKRCWYFNIHQSRIWYGNRPVLGEVSWTSRFITYLATIKKTFRIYSQGCSSSNNVIVYVFSFFSKIVFFFHFKNFCFGMFVLVLGRWKNERTIFFLNIERIFFKRSSTPPVPLKYRTTISTSFQF